MSDKELNFSELNVEVFMDYSTVEESRERHKKSFVPVQLNHLMHSKIVTSFCSTVKITDNKMLHFRVKCKPYICQVSLGN